MDHPQIDLGVLNKLKEALSETQKFLTEAKNIPPHQMVQLLDHFEELDQRWQVLQDTYKNKVQKYIQDLSNHVDILKTELSESQKQPEPALEQEMPQTNESVQKEDSLKVQKEELVEVFEEQATLQTDAVQSEDPASNLDVSNLNDQLKKAQNVDINSSIELKSGFKELSFDVNDRIFFQNELFNADPYEFHVSLKEMQKCENIAQFKTLVQGAFNKKYDWSEKKEAVDRLYSCVQTKINNDV